ncbi:hypothetical protein IPC762_26025 [Pseudomonas aeruginosa]|uniref:hypothetical protein n=1 Tax=Pseudomonas aeruginosa TaxID=287 RepID=UPI000FD52AD9|nr:hypothetical protein [Pseudomonas aeruginosa]RUG15305.1 hypothetical protein IPC762_26025 [Pseudomonas aeruginosa]
MINIQPPEVSDKYKAIPPPSVWPWMTRPRRVAVLALGFVVGSFLTLHERDTNQAITKAVVEYASLFPAPYTTAETARIIQAENIRISAAAGKSDVLVVELAPGRACSAVLGGLYAAGMWAIGADGHQLTPRELRAACRGDERVTLQIRKNSTPSATVSRTAKYIS